MSAGLFNNNPENNLYDNSLSKEAFDSMFYKKHFELSMEMLSTQGIAFFSLSHKNNELSESILVQSCNSVFSQWLSPLASCCNEPISLQQALSEADFSTLKSIVFKLKSGSEVRINEHVNLNCVGQEVALTGVRVGENLFSFFCVKNTTSGLVSDSLVASVCNILPFALRICGADGTFLYGNKSLLHSNLQNVYIDDLVTNSKTDKYKFGYQIGFNSHEAPSRDYRKEYLELTRNNKKEVFEVWEKPFSTQIESDFKITTFANVSERAEYEKNLKRKKHQLEESQRIAHVGSWEYNFETDSLLCSDELYKIVGLEPDERACIKQALVRLFNKTKRQEVLTKYRTIFASDISIYKNEVAFRNKWGREIILQDTGKIVRDKNGAALRLYATVQDITETKKTNEELRSSREKLMSLLNAMPDRVFVINTDKIFTEYYDNIPGVSTVQEENYRGYRISDVFTEDIAKQFENILKNTFELQLPQIFEYTEGEGLFERWYEVRTTVCNAKEVVFLVREITQSRKSTQELIKAKQRAEESDSLKSAFLANISHEIRTPLNAMMGFSNILAEESLTEEEKEKYLSIINKNADQLTSLFSDLLDISKIESGQLKIFKEQININSEFDKLYHQFIQYKKHSSKEKLELKLKLSLDDDAAVVVADETRFTQIISNLLTNALKFTENGYVEFGYEKPAKGKLKFFVKDTGKGIPQEELESIFKRFRQSATNNVKKHGGTGLGLAISESLVNLMGGRLWVESELGKGSTFWFTLPY